MVHEMIQLLIELLPKEIFEKPEFYINGPTASDVRQGRDGDCWFMAALCTMGNKQGLIEKICVARNEKIGVYGFLFYRGELLSVLRGIRMLIFS